MVCLASVERGGFTVGMTSVSRSGKARQSSKNSGKDPNMVWHFT